MRTTDNLHEMMLEMPPGKLEVLRTSREPDTDTEEWYFSWLPLGSQWPSTIRFYITPEQDRGRRLEKAVRFLTSEYVAIETGVVAEPAGDS